MAVSQDFENLSMKQPIEGSRPVRWIVVMATAILAAACGWFFLAGEEPAGTAQREAVETVLPGDAPAASESGRSEAVPAEVPQVAALPAALPTEGEGKVAAKPVDGVVQPRFIDDLARFFVDGYHPARNAVGSIGIGVQEANMRYGMRMLGLRHKGKDVSKGRRSVLGYAFTPSMVQWLYDIYADRFMAAVGQRVDQARLDGEGWPSGTKADFYGRYATQLSRLADTLKGISALSASSLSADLKRIHALGDDVVAAENKYSEVMFAAEQARERGRSDTKSVERRQAAAAAKRYQNAVIARETARHALCSRIADGAGSDAKVLPDDTVLFVAQWVERRVRTNPSHFAAVHVASQRIGDLASRFDAASRRWSR